MFDLNLRLNQLKINWHHFNDLYTIATGTAKSFYKDQRDSQNRVASMLRESNSHLEGVLQESHSVQFVQELTFKRHVIARDNDIVKMTVRVDQKNTVYYALPKYTDSTGEQVYDQSFTNYKHGNIAKTILGELSVDSDGLGKFPISSITGIVSTITDRADVTPIGQRTTIAGINQLSTDYFATFISFQGKCH